MMGRVSGGVSGGLSGITSLCKSTRESYANEGPRTRGKVRRTANEGGDEETGKTPAHNHHRNHEGK